MHDCMSCGGNFCLEDRAVSVLFSLFHGIVVFRIRQKLKILFPKVTGGEKVAAISGNAAGKDIYFPFVLN